MTNFEAFFKGIKLSISLLFLKSGLRRVIKTFRTIFCSVLHMIGLLEGYSSQDMKRMSRGPLITSMRNIYGRPTVESLKAEMAKPKTKSFLVARDPFKRLLSGYRNKILGAYKGSHHDKLSRKILETYRGLPKHKYKFRKTIPTFSEFVSYMLDTHEQAGEVDMHWAPVVDFCSVCQV